MQPDLQFATQLSADFSHLSNKGVEVVVELQNVEFYYINNGG